MFGRSLRCSPRLCWPILAASLFAISCSSSTTVYPVKGQILFNDQPAEGVLIRLHWAGAPITQGQEIPLGTGRADGGGNFEIESTVQGKAVKGLPVGDYIATFEWTPPTAAGGGFGSMKDSGKAPPPPKDKLEGRYKTLEKGQKVPITKGENVLPPFKLK